MENSQRYPEISSSFDLHKLEYLQTLFKQSLALVLVVVLVLVVLLGSGAGAGAGGRGGGGGAAAGAGAGAAAVSGGGVDGCCDFSCHLQALLVQVLCQYNKRTSM